jgi:hypothetical protein
MSDDDALTPERVASIMRRGRRIARKRAERAGMSGLAAELTPALEPSA